MEQEMTFTHCELFRGAPKTIQGFSFRPMTFIDKLKLFFSAYFIDAETEVIISESVLCNRAFFTEDRQ